MDTKQVLREDEIICKRTLYSDGSSGVVIEFRKSNPESPDLNNESINFMLTFMTSFIRKWRREIFGVRKHE